MKKLSLGPALSWAALLAAVALFVGVLDEVLLEDGRRRLADALPLYLYAAAVEAGLSPIDPENLRQVYEARGMTVGAATWSTLYPASTGVMLRPVAGLSWAGFETLWTWVLAAAGLAVGLLVPTPAGASGTRRRFTQAAAVALMALFPATLETPRLGQINMLLAALSAGALVLMTRRRDLAAGALLGVGACLKLVPAAVALPLFLGKRWKVAAGGCLIGVPVMLLSFTVTPPVEFIQGLRETSTFQSIITPAWLILPELPGWIWHLGFTRHNALMLLTGILSVGAALWRPSTGVLVGAGALVLAWLGTDASVFHLLYTPLYAPAWLWLCAWALHPDAPRWTWPISLAFAVAGVWMPDQRWWALDTTVACMLLGFAIWLGVAGRTLWEALRAEERGPIAPLLDRWPAPAASLLGLTATLIVASVGLPEIGAPPVDQVVDEGGELRYTGAGFIDPAERPPGADEGLAMGLGVPQDGAQRWPTMSVTGSLLPGSRRKLDRHLNDAPGLWAAQAALITDPTLAEAAAELGRATPPRPLRRLSYQQLATWLAAEGALLHQLEARGEAPHGLREGWEAVLDPEPPR